MEILKIHNNPERAEWTALTERFTREEEEITRQVTEILADVKSGGDRSLREVTRRVEGRDPRTFEIPADVRAAAAALIPAALKEALAAAKANIETFHRAQLPPEVDIETMPGVRCVQRAVPIRRVGLYIPGGKAPLFSTVLMLAVPARVAGCGEVILRTPARPDGTLAPEIPYAADLCGVDRIFSVGGAQAVAAMASARRASRASTRFSVPATAMSPRPSNWSAPTTWPSTCPPGPRRCWCWPTTKRRPPSPPPTCCRRPNTVMTVRPCWSAAARSSHSGQ